MYINIPALEAQGVEVHVDDDSIRLEFNRDQQLDTRNLEEQLYSFGLPPNQIGAILDGVATDANNQMMLAAITRSRNYSPPVKHAKAKKF